MRGVDSGVGISHREVSADVGVDLVGDVREELVIRGHLRRESPRIGENPGARVHCHVEVCIGDPFAHVSGVVGGLWLAEGTIARGRLVLGPVMVVIAIEIDLIHVPAGVGIVAVGVQHDHYVEFGVLQDANRLSIPRCPSFDVEFSRQEGQFGPQMFVTVVPAVDVDLFFWCSIALVGKRPVGYLHDPLVAPIQCLTR